MAALERRLTARVRASLLFVAALIIQPFILVPGLSRDLPAGLLPAAANVVEQGDATSSESETGSDTGSDTGGVQPADTQTESDDGLSESQENWLIAVLIVLGLCCIGLVVLLLRRRASAPLRPSSRPATGWRERTTRACNEGRELVDLAADTQPGQPGSGLTIEQLRLVDVGLDLLVGELHDLEASAPSPQAAQSLRIATSHASAMKGIVQTERSLRLSLVTPDDSFLRATALHLSEERGLLDHSLRDIFTNVDESR